MKLPTWAKWLLGLFAVLVVIAIASGVYLFQKVSNAPRTWNAEASVEIAVPAGEVEPLVASLERWKDWSAWRRDCDEGVVRRFEPLEDGAQRLKWGEGVHLQINIGSPPTVGPSMPKDSIGRGEVTLRPLGAGRYGVETIFKDRLAISYVDPQGAGSTAFTLDSQGHEFVFKGELTFEANASGGTKVTWSEDGDFGSVFAAGMLALAGREYIAKQHLGALRSSLERLKQIAETQAR